MLTPSATRFVGPLTFAALSRHPVETDVLDLLPDQRIGHIVVADTADAIVVAPATARWLGAMAGGIADDAVPRRASRRRRRWSSRRRWTATCGRTRRPASTSSACAASSATGSSSPWRVLGVGPERHRPARGAATTSSTRWSRRSATPHPPARRRRPPAGRGPPRRLRPRGAPHRRDRRAAPRRPSTPCATSATGARADGDRDRRGGPRPRRARDHGRGPLRGPGPARHQRGDRPVDRGHARRQVAADWERHRGRMFEAFRTTSEWLVAATNPRAGD